MVKKSVYIADLTHTAQGISAATFPLGASYVYAFAKKEHPDCEFSLFKFPDHLSTALESEPMILAMSNYSWNFELSYAMAALAKQRWPQMVVVFGGPNFPTDAEEKRQFMLLHECIDYYVELEGEIGFSQIVGAIKNESPEVTFEN